MKQKLTPYLLLLPFFAMTALVLVPYIQSGDRALAAIYAVAFVASALGVFFLFEGVIHGVRKEEAVK